MGFNCLSRTARRWRCGNIAVAVLFAAAPVPHSVKAEQHTERYFLSPQQLSGITVPFIENRGQLPEPVSFYARLFAGSVYVGDEGIVYSLTKSSPADEDAANRAILKERALGAALPFTPYGSERGKGVVNSYVGLSRAEGVKTFNVVSLGEVWSGITLELAARANNVEKIFRVSPNASPATIKMTLDGALTLKTAADGRLLVSTTIGEVAMTAPVAYQVINGIRQAVPVAYSLDGLTYGFTVSKYDRTHELVIDPLLASTFIGGEALDTITALKTDSLGNVLITGWTDSVSYPISAGAYDTVRNITREAFVTKMRGDLTGILFSTYFGGTAINAPAGITVDGSNNVVVVGWTNSTDFPTTAGAYDTTVSSRDLFISKFSANLGTLTASTVYGGSGDDHGTDIKLAPDGTIAVIGHTLSSDLPTTGAAYATASGGARDAFVARFSSNLSSLLAGTYLGGNGEDEAFSLAVASSGNLVLTGDTDSTNFPTTAGALDVTAENREAFVATFNPSLQSLLASTLIGGSGDDRGYAVAISSAGDLYLAGDTTSNNLAVTGGAYDVTFNGVQDGFVARLSSDLTNLIAATFIGGAQPEYLRAIALDAETNVFITGATNSTNYPTTSGAFDTTYGGGSDAMIAKFSSTLSQLLVSTFVGGNVYDTGTQLVLDNAGNVTLAGNTLSLDFPTLAGGYDTAHDDGRYADGFVLKIGGSLSGTTLLVSNVNSTTADGTYAEGSTILITIKFTEAVTVNTAGGMPQLALNSGGVASYVSGSGSDTVVMSYPVAVGQSSADLDYTSSVALSLNGGTIRSIAKNELLDTTLPPPGAVGSLGRNRALVIDTAVTIPVIDTPPQNLITNATLLPITGSAEGGSTVTLYDGGASLGTTTANSAGSWSFTPTTLFIDGNHDFTATALDSVGHLSAPSAVRTITVDTVLPLAPVISAPLGNATVLQSKPSIEGSATGESGSVVAVSIDNLPAGTTTVDETGAWQFVTPAALVNGPHTVSAAVTDRAGNAGPQSADVAFVVDAPLDTDGDGVSDVDEAALGTDPNNPDSDNDGNLDGDEVAAGSDPLDPASTVDDIDGDGLSNVDEIANGTDPTNPDSDGDGATDGQEVTTGSDPHDPGSVPPAGSGTTDSDGDGISDANEIAQGTNPFNADSDNDEVSDRQEQLDGTDPLDRGSVLSVLKTTVCAEWNGFLGMFNIMEHVNMASRELHLQTTLYSIDGAAQGTLKFAISPGAQFDVLVHDLPGRIADSYGKVCTTHDGAAGDLDGRMVYYKPTATGGYEFAFAMPFSNGIKGTQSVPFNTYQPSLSPAESLNFVANWIQLTNPNTSTQGGVLSFYSPDGVVLGSQRVDLPAGARRDFSGHQFGPNLVGVTEWKPDDSTIPFLLRNVRYYYDSPNSAVNHFASAAQFSGQPGSGKLLSAPLDTEGKSAIVEIANVADQANDVSADVYNAAGTLLNSLHLRLNPHASFHLISDALLKGGKGIVLVQGSVRAGLTATAMHYGRDAGLALNYMYGIPAAEALGVNLAGSYNTFLNQRCSLQLVNPAAAEERVIISTTRYDGTRTLGNGLDLVVPGHGLLDFNLCSRDVLDVYGVVTVQPERVNGLMGTVIRLGASDQYRFPTELRQ